MWKERCCVTHRVVAWLHKQLMHLLGWAETPNKIGSPGTRSASAMEFEEGETNIDIKIRHHSMTYANSEKRRNKTNTMCVKKYIQTIDEHQTRQCRWATNCISAVCFPFTFVTIWHNRPQYVTIIAQAEIPSKRKQQQPPPKRVYQRWEIVLISRLKRESSVFVGLSHPK